MPVLRIRQRDSYYPRALLAEWPLGSLVSDEIKGVGGIKF